MNKEKQNNVAQVHNFKTYYKSQEIQNLLKSTLSTFNYVNLST